LYFQSLDIYVGMALVLPDSHTKPEDRPQNGTFTFVDTKRMALVLTAHHVYKHFTDMKKENPDAILALGHANCFENISDAILIDAEPGCDLAVLKLRYPGQLLDWGKRYLTHNSWPPPRPVKGDRVLALGYPGAFKHSDEPTTLSFRPAMIDYTVSSVTERSVSLNKEGDRIIDPSFILPLTRLGGMSGGAVLSGVPARKPILSGIVCQALSGSADIIIASHADFINEDGTIIRDR
jgi:hypothetical protein